MLSNSHFLKQIDQASLESTLEAIASKGLLRRAKKDLQQGETPEIIAETVTVMTIRVADAEVTIPAQGVAKASCNCSAVDVCRHILMSCLWLAQNPAVAEAAPKSEEQPKQSEKSEELLSYSIDDLVKWAGKKTVNAAIALLDQPENLAEIVEAIPITITIPKQNATCRFFPKAGLAGMVCSCKSRECRHLVLAVLCYQRSHGVAIAGLASPPSSLLAASGSPRSRVEVLQAAKRLLEESISVGLCHLSTAFDQRYTTLAVSATGVNLPRLAKLLRSIAEDLQLISDRHAKANEARLFLTSARTYALCEAILNPILVNQTPPSYLIGWHRTQYEDVGNLDLAGMGAYNWTSASGYAGLTVLFWDILAKQWCSWSEARPTFQGSGFNPRSYLHTSPWEGANAAELSQTRFKLLAAKRNHQNRLSGSTQSQIAAITNLNLQELDFGDRLFQSWDLLYQYAVTMTTVGLKEYDPLHAIVIITPIGWGHKSFDQITQTFTWLVKDVDGAELPLQVPFREVDQQRLKYLESLEPTNIWGIVAQIKRDRAGIGLYPISLLTHSIPPIINLSFASNSAPTSPASSSAKVPDDLPDHLEKEELDIADSEDEITSGRSEGPLSNLEKQIEKLIGELQRCSEQGSDRLTAEINHQFHLEAKIFESAGLKSISSSITNLFQPDANVASHLLQLRYLCDSVTDLLKGLR